MSSVTTTSLAIIFIATFLGALWLHVSPWFLWELAPMNSEISFLLNYTRPTQEISQRLAATYKLTDYIPLDATATSRFVYSRTNDSDTLIVVPRLVAQRSLKTQLIQEGWQVRRLGLVLIATQSGTAHPSAPSVLQGTQSIIKALHTMLIARLPSNPLLIATAQENALPIEHLAINTLAYVDTSTLHIVIGFNTDQFSRWQSVREEETSPVDMLVSLPGAYITLLPPEIRSQWDSLLYTHLGLSRTAPLITESLSQYDQALVAINGEQGSAIAVTGSVEKFFSSANSWVGDENAQYNPMRQAFRLPDNTVGFEQRPAAPQPAFQSEPDATGCHAPTATQSMVWFCRQGAHAALASQKQMAQQALRSLSENTQVLSLNQPNLSAHRVDNTLFIQMAI